MKVIVLVDLQNDFVSGALGSPEAQAIIPNVCERVIKIAQESSEAPLVLYTKDTHYENYLDTQEGKNLPVPHCIYGTPGWSINKAVSSTIDYSSELFRFYSSGDIINSRILKTTFGSTDLIKVLKLVNAEEIIFMGLCTDVCLVSNCLAAKMTLPEVPITVYSDCCAGVTPAKHEAALETMRSCQINVI